MIGCVAIAVIVLIPVTAALILAVEKTRGRRPGLVVAVFQVGMWVNVNVTGTLAVVAIVKSIDPQNGLVVAVRDVLVLAFGDVI